MPQLNKKGNMNEYITISRTSSFEMAHRLVTAYTQECNETIHGHSYKWRCFVSGRIGEGQNMLLDFSILSSCMSIVDKMLDHGCCHPFKSVSEYDAVGPMFGRKVIPVYPPVEPTAERLAVTMRNTMTRLLKGRTPNGHALVVVVELFETENSSVLTEAMSWEMLVDPSTLFFVSMGGNVCLKEKKDVC